jgi:hypothetical protein
MIQRIRIFLATLPQGIRGLEQRVSRAQSQLGEINSSFTAPKREALFGTVGKALSAWSKMEEYLVVIVAHLLRVRGPKAGLIMYSILNFSVWLSLIHDLMEMDEIYAPLLPKWNKFGERIRRIKDQRDQLAHHSVSMKDKTGVRSSRLDIRQKTKRQRPLDLEEANDFILTVLTITEGLGDFIDAMDSLLPTSPQESPAPEPGHSPESGGQ